MLPLSYQIDYLKSNTKTTPENCRFSLICFMVPQVICMKLWPIRLNWVKFINLASSEKARSTCTHMIKSKVPEHIHSLIRQKPFCCPLDGITCHIDRMVEVLIEYFKHFLLLSCQADCCSVALVDTDTERGSRGLHPCFAQNQGLLPPFSLKGDLRYMFKPTIIG